MQVKEAGLFCPSNRAEWREWLLKNHAAQASVWLVYHKKKSGKPTISWSEAVEEALCFGWIDSRARPIDNHTFMQFFCKRKPGSGWSKINKEKVQHLTDNGQMAEAGLHAIDTAKKNGAWTKLDDVENLTIPKDLGRAFRANKGAKKFFEGLSRSVRKSMLQWITLAKRPETRQKRIDEIATLAARQLKPKPF